MMDQVFPNLQQQSMTKTSTVQDLHLNYEVLHSNTKFLPKTFPLFLDEDDEVDALDDEEERPLEGVSADKPDAVDSSKSSSFLLGQNWRDLIPVIKIDMVRQAFLERLVLIQLLLHWNLLYSTSSNFV